jgi:hypothetical protein
MFSNEALGKRMFFIALDEMGAPINPKLQMRSLCVAPPGYDLDRVLTRSLIDLRKTRRLK